MTAANVSGFDKFRYHKALRVGKALTHPEYRVLSVLWDYSSADGRNARPGHARLAEDCGMSGRTVERCIASLLEKGWIHRDKPGRSRGRDGGGYAACYSLRTPPDWQPPSNNDPPQTSESSATTDNHPPTPTESPDVADGPSNHALPKQLSSKFYSNHDGEWLEGTQPDCSYSSQPRTEPTYVDESSAHARDCAESYPPANTGKPRPEEEWGDFEDEYRDWERGGGSTYHQGLKEYPPF